MFANPLKLCRLKYKRRTRNNVHQRIKYTTITASEQFFFHSLSLSWFSNPLRCFHSFGMNRRMKAISIIFIVSFMRVLELNVQWNSNYFQTTDSTDLDIWIFGYCVLKSNSNRISASNKQNRTHRYSINATTSFA